MEEMSHQEPDDHDSISNNVEGYLNTIGIDAFKFAHTVLLPEAMSSTTVVSLFIALYL